MTLVTALGNPAFVVQVADRRLTGPMGALPDEQTKAIHFHLPAADFLAGYTGLARVHSEPMHQVLMKLLVDSAAQSSFEVMATADAITSNLTGLFQSPRVRSYTRANRRLTLMLTGFHRVSETQYTLIQGLWTNFQDWGVDDDAEAWDEFVFSPFSVKSGEEWLTLIQRVGAYDAIPPELVEKSLRPLLAPGKPPAAVRNKLISLLPAQSAKHPTVGPNANAAVLYPNGQVEWSYWTGSPRWENLQGNSVIAIPDEGFMLSDMEIRAVNPEDTPPMVVQQVPKQQPCPCGSGKRYRQCHGLRR